MPPRAMSTGVCDPDAVPWRAVGKLQAVSENLRDLCTGALSARRWC
jgi:hypothetical protein